MSLKFEKFAPKVELERGKAKIAFHDSMAFHASMAFPMMVSWILDFDGRNQEWAMP